MPIYRDEDFVRAAVDSVLRQTFADFELIVVNDACVDRSREIVEEYRDPRIRIVDNPRNLGLAPTFNHGISVARGELVSRIDSNDIVIDAAMFEKQIAFLDQHPEVAAVGTQARMIDMEGRRMRHSELRQPTSSVGILWKSMFDSPLTHTGTMFRRSVVWDELGGYDERFRYSEDADLWFRVAARHALANLDDPCVARRFDPGSISRDVNHPVRLEARERTLALLQSAMRRVLRLEAVPDQWIWTWGDLYWPPSDAQSPIRNFPDIVEAMHRRFVEIHPEAEGDADVAAWRAHLLTAAALRIARSHRRRSLSILMRSLSVSRAGLMRRTVNWTAHATGTSGMARRLRQTLRRFTRRVSP
jgi:glycosyltransferase involved in cell wall biosynthesis